MSNGEAENRFTELVAFIRDKSGEHEMLIARETLTEEDLGVTGSDAEELIISFGKKNNVDIQNLNFTKYFYDEPGIFNFQNWMVEPFTVGHLEKVMIEGRLEEEVIRR